MRLKRLLVTTDFSLHANFALQRAVDIAEKAAATLTCLHVVRQNWLTSLALLGHNSEEELNNRVRKSEQHFQKILKKTDHQESVNFVVLAGHVSDTIIEYVHDDESDLLIMGAHGTYFLNDYILGTTSRKAVKQSTVPIMLIKKEPKKPYALILIAVDFSKSCRRAVEFAYQLFPKAEFLLLHVADVWYEKALSYEGDNEQHHELEHAMVKEITSRMAVFLQSCNVDKSLFKSKIMGGYPADEIATQASKWKADLLVFGTSSHSQLESLLMGSVAMRLLGLGASDMLVVPPK